MQKSVIRSYISAVFTACANLCLSFSLILATSSASFANTPTVQAPPAGISADALAASEKAVEALEKIRGAIDTKTTSLENMAEFLDYDPDAAIDYVTNEIGFLPYAGSMRGPIGAMETGSASALDQALLLGGLLEVMGMDVALAYGALEESDVNRLMRKSTKVEFPETALRVDDVSESLDFVNADIQELRSANSNNISAQFNTYTDNVTRAVTASLGEPFKAETGSSLDILKDYNSKSYVWVKYKSEPNAEWQDVHPSFDADAPRNLTANKFSEISPPDAEVHKFSFRVSVEVSEKGSAREFTILNYMPAAISDLASRQLSLSIGPEGISPGDIQAGLSAPYFVAMVDDAVLPGTKAFSKHGEVVPVEAVRQNKGGAAAASLFEGINASLGSLDGSEEDAKHITGIWLESVYKSPLGEKTYRRSLVDFDNAKPGQALIAAQGVSEVVFDFNIGQTNNARALLNQTKSIQAHFAHLPWKVAVIKEQIGMDAYTSQTDLVNNPAPTIWMDMALNQAAFLPTKIDGNTVVPLQALVSSRRVALGFGGAGDTRFVKSVIDLMTTDAVVLSGDSETLKINQRAGMKLGLKQTFSETALIQNGEIVETNMNGEEALDIIKSDSDLSEFLEKTPLDRTTEMRLRSDLSGGVWLAVVKASPDTPLNWWKVDLASGHTLGMTRDGGAENSIYVIVTTFASKNAASIAITLFGLGTCGLSYYADRNASSALFCVLANLTLFGIGAGLGASLSGLTAGQAIGMTAATDLMSALVGWTAQTVWDAN